MKDAYNIISTECVSAKTEIFHLDAFTTTSCDTTEQVVNLLFDI